MPEEPTRDFSEVFHFLIFSEEFPPSPSSISWYLSKTEMSEYVPLSLVLSETPSEALAEQCLFDQKFLILRVLLVKKTKWAQSEAADE